MPEKKNIKTIIDKLIDKDGIKTEVTVTLTNETVTKIILALLASGLTLILVAQITKNLIANNQLTRITEELNTIKNNLKTITK